MVADETFIHNCPGRLPSDQQLQYRNGQERYSGVDQASRQQPHDDGRNNRQYEMNNCRQHHNQHNPDYHQDREDYQLATRERWNQQL
jgi:hypothetical protein